MTLRRQFILLLVLLTVSCVSALAQSNVVVFREPGFPTADSAPMPDAFIQSAIQGSKFSGVAELKQQLQAAKLLVLPYGSAFPEEAWTDILGFLQRGGNLLVLGGRPFSRAAYRDGNQWKLRDYSVRYMRSLMIDQYQDTPGSGGLRFEANPDVPLGLQEFAWKQGFSPIIHLSAVSLYERGGSAGSIDSNLTPLVWGTNNGRRMAAPMIEIDHLRNGFEGGRWIFADADLGSDFYNSPNSGHMVSTIAQQAMLGAEEFTARPTLPLYLPGESVELEVHWNSAEKNSLSLEIESWPEEQPSKKQHSSVKGPFTSPVMLAGPVEKGLHIIEAKLLDGSKVRAIYHSGFWVRDQEFLQSGPKLGVNHDFFEVDGKPLAVIGTTYMSSEVQRLYFDHPNVYVWNQDLKQIHDAGLNMVRSGWWTGWDKFVDENGIPYERTLRTMEAYLMTARKYGLPVQFNVFAFLPEVLGGVNPYLDAAAVRKQTTLVAALAERFRDVPFLAFDLINEPSFSKHIWTMRPNGDWIEIQRWNEWLDKHYPNHAALAAAWNVPITSVQGTVPLPTDVDFMPRGMYDGHNSLKTYDYDTFAQESFAQWVGTLRDSIRGAGSNALITVGQDEGGFQDRLSPAFFGSNVDFTTNHSWWQNDSILWDSLVAKQPGKAMLIQETGLQRELNLDESSRRTAESEAALFERKVATSFVDGSGAIEWLWNTNSYMTEGNETPIGALRADGTEKPEATVMRDFAKFAAVLGPHLRHPQPAQVAIFASQATQYSALAEGQIEAQRKATRALGYYARLTPYLIYENHLDQLGTPKLVVLPSAQALTQHAWRTLLTYVEGGGNLLITGPIDRDEHWQRVDRAAELIPGAHAVPLTYHNASVLPADSAGTQGLRRMYSSPLSFDLQAQSWLESLRFGEQGFKELTHGNGRIFWAAEPVELAAGDQPTADVYSYVAGRIGLQPQFELPVRLSPGVMVYPMPLEDSILYIFVSDAADDANVDLRDKSTGTKISFNLKAEHAALALVGRKEKAVIGKYGF